MGVAGLKPIVHILEMPEPYMLINDIPVNWTEWSVCGDGWLNLCTLIAHCSTSMQSRSAPESNQSDSGQGRLPNTSDHPHTLHTHIRQIALLFRAWRLRRHIAMVADNWGLGEF